MNMGQNLSYFHVPESSQKILRTRLKTDMVVLVNSRNFGIHQQNKTMDMSDSETVVNEDEYGCRLDVHMTCV